ncbi:MAG: adenylosuccinate synthase [Polyangia bacterium]
MANVVIVGAQWGDEGKGKVVDLYSEFADVVVRFGGGANAGHTLVVDGQKLVTHLVPSGVLHGRGRRFVLADGMVIDPAALRAEIAALAERGITLDADLIIASGAHVILPIHKLVDEVREAGRGAIGTTKRGIGPAYEAKMARRGVRFADLLDEKRLRELIEHNLEEVGPYLRARGKEPPTVEAMLTEYLDHGRALGKHVKNASRLVSDEMRRGQNVLFEGAQGALLDVDHGTYPFVTSSTTTAAGACASCGVGPTEIDTVIGITKAYTTRVGGGPFPTEDAGEVGQRLRDVGGEYGATTGRPRRCGWLDVAALRRAVRLNGLAGLALTKVDVLSGMSQLKICVGYKLPGSSEIRDELPSELSELVHAEPVYEELEGWQESLRELRDLEALPKAARRYLRRIEELTGTPLALVSVGPARAETIMLKNPFR